MGRRTTQATAVKKAVAAEPKGVGCRLNIDRTGARITRMLVPLVHLLGMKVLAEGVETAHQAQMLREIGCDEAQGYPYARPMVTDDLLASLGGLVAGVAHELNTPLGNSLMAVSTPNDDLREFRASLQQGLRRSALDRLLQSVEAATGIAGRITVRGTITAPGQIGLQVEDDGRGIAAPLIDRVFEPFVTSRMGRGGRGLRVRSNPAAGSRFRTGAS